MANAHTHLAHAHPIAVVQLLVLEGTERVQAASSQPALGRYLRLLGNEIASSMYKLY